MPELSQLLLLFGVGLVAGILNVMAGGGSSITLPVLILLGLDGAMANGTNRVAIVLQNVFASASFHRERVGGLQKALMLGLWTIPGAIVGALVAVEISDEWFRRILGIVMIGVAVSMLIPRKSVEEQLAGDKRSRWIYPSLFAIGFYGGFIQVGVGFLFMAAYYHLLRMNLVRVNMYKVVAVLLYTIPALIIFSVTGNVDWGLGLSLATGNSLGGWWAVKLSVRRGDRLIRFVLLVAVLVLAAKILGIM